MIQSQINSSFTLITWVSKVFKATMLGVLFLLFPMISNAQNNCLSFDGTDDYVNLGPLSPTGNFSTGFTFMGWVKWNAFNFYAPVFVFGDGVNNSDNANQISISGYATLNGISVRCSNTSLIVQGCTALNQWVHIAVTVTETGSMTIYVNGSSVSWYNVSPISNVVRTSCTLGTATYYNKFNGCLDEISVWSRALTVTEIQNKMNSSLAGNESGLYAYYHFNQAAPGGTNTGCTTLLDAGVNAKNGTLTNFALTGTSSNWLSSDIPVTIDNNALAFDGTNDYVNLGTVSPTGNFSAGYTYMGWVKWGAFNSWSRLFDFGTGAGYNNIMLANNSTSNSLTLSNYLNTTPYQLTTGNILSPNQWVHVAATVSNTGAAKIYVNGVVAASGNVSAPVNIARNLCYLGKSNWVADAYLNASMDEVSFWTRALTADEINTNMNSSLTGGETGLYAYYRFNQASANGTNTGLSTLFDATANGKNGILTNMSLSGISSNWISSGAPASTQNNALSFDGTNDFVAIPALASNLTQFTIETWFNANNFISTPFSGIFNTNSWVNGDVHFQLTNATIQLAVCGSTVATVNYSFSPNTWYHLAATYNSSTKKVNVYVNGTLVQNVTLATALNANFTAAEIGAFGASRYFAGKLDEYRIWNTERTATDISTNMYKSFNGTESGLIAYFNFNEGNAAGTNAGITSLNNGIGTNHGTLTNFALSGTTSNWVTGIKDKPSSHVTNFSGSVVSSKMTLKWTDVINGNSPDGYYIFASKTNSFTDPVNGVEPSIDNDLTDGVGVVKVLQGVQVYNGWINDELNTPYYFRIYPYTNSGVNTLYNTIATVPQVQVTSAGQFSIQDGIAFPSLNYSAFAWGDYDNDGNLDLIMTGDSSSVPITRIFKGNGLGGFAPQYQIKMQGVEYGSVAWGDYNNDGYLDVLLTGSTTSAWPHTMFSRIYKNNKNGTFTEQSQIDIFPINNGSAIWGDFDNDGDLDILLAGSGVAKIYRNNGDNSFTDLISLIGVTYGAATWGDYDNDGYLDVVYSGIGSEGNRTTKLYRNNGDNTFSLQTNTGLPNFLGPVALGDYNNDGLLDLFLGNYDGSKIYKNMGNNSFTEQASLAAAQENGSASWIDYDNDGFLDIFVAGYSSGYGSVSVKLYRNTDGNTFSEVTPQSWPTLIGQTFWADFDNDNRIDFLLGGYGNSFTGLYHNNIKTFNTAPPTPSNLSVSKQVRTGTFKWEYPKLAESAKFNLRVGTSSGSSNIVTAQSLANGTRLLYNNSTLIRDTSFTLNPLKVGNYFWSVQAVDANGKASSFAPEQTFSVDTIQSSNLVASNVNSTTIKLKWKRGNGDGCIVFCKANKSTPSYPVNGVIYKHSSRFGEGSRIAGTDWFCVYNGQADSVTVSGLNTGLTYTVHVMEYSTLSNSDKYFRKVVDNNIGYFSPSLYTDIQTLASVGVLYGSVEWGDYDKDGYLDILVTGVLVSNQFYARVYHNNGDNTFTPLATFNLLLPDNAITRYNDRFLGKWADFDNDGYLDIVIVDAHNYGNAKILRNNTDISGTTFTQQFDFGNDFSTGTCEDLDNDGYLDVVLTGANDTRIYKNNGNFTFTLQTTIPFMTYNSSLSCGDFNNDGLSDILLTGYHKLGEYNFAGASKIYQNKGNFEFVEKTDVTLEGICYGVGQWVDYDNDGLLDIFLTGNQRFSDPPLTLLYHNDGNGNFTSISNTGIGSFMDSNADWGDYNNDGYLDLIVGGQNGGLYTKVYRNNKNGTFTEDTDFFITGCFYGSAKWCDYDDDGDLDILFAGNNNLKIYQNTTTSIAGKYAINKKPNAPTNLENVVTPNKVTLSWSSALNDETPSISMSYNLRYRIVGATNWSYAPSTNGTVRLFSALGNVQMNKRIDLANLPVGQYEWNVQTIDQGYLGSDWSANGNFEVRDLQTFFSAEIVCQGLPTQFTDQSVSTDGIASWKWDFKDGSISTVQNPTHTFAAGGAYTVKLVITSTGGAKDSLEKSVTVKPKPITGFTATTACQGTSTTITNTTDANGLTIDSWSWDFGDGQSSTIQQPSPHGYLNTGDYLVKLKAISSNGCTDSISKNVAVASYPIAAITANAPLSFCKGDSVTLSVPYNNKFIYTWKVDGTNLTNSDSSKYIAKLTGNYVVEVVNSIGNCTTLSSQVNIIAQNAPVVPLITANGSLQFCQDESVTLSATNVDGYTYQWNLNGGAVGENSNQYIAKDKGKYSLTVANSNGCSVNSTNSLDVDVLPKPTLPILNLSGPTSFCSGGSVTLNATSNSEYTYRWKNELGVISGANTNSLIASTSGKYQLEISNTQGCSVITPVVNVTANTLPAKPIIAEATNTTLYCLGTEVELKVTNSSSTLNYQWKRSGVIVDGATQSNYKGRLAAGDYRVEASQGNCATESDIITLTTKPAPAKPNLYAWGPNVWILACDNNSAKDYRWYYNDQLIVGAKTNQYVARQNFGNYYVEISDGGECYAMSDIINIPTGNVINGIDDLVDDVVTLFPNPTDGLITVLLGNTLSGDLNVEFVDDLGKVIIQNQYHNSNGFSIDLTGAPKGIYFCKLHYKNSLVVKKIIKQ
ncbi:MAG: PKD domain-containing protein [Bacteroidales bacterium]|nr:PKD domain-containing protein [Bacteroidales bacterium]